MRENENGEQNLNRRQMMGRVAGGVGIASILGRRAAFAQAPAGGFPQVPSWKTEGPLAARDGKLGTAQGD